MTDVKYDRCEIFVSFANADAAGRMFAEAICGSSPFANGGSRERAGGCVGGPERSASELICAMERR
jgi:hypothetical protein